MSRVLVTGSADGLGRLTAQTLLREGHRVVVQVRSEGRLTAVKELLSQGAEAVVGDLSDPEQTRGVANQVRTAPSAPTTAATFRWLSPLRKPANAAPSAAAIAPEIMKTLDHRTVLSALLRRSEMFASQFFPWPSKVACAFG